jgi:type I restriction-modification system DNA methylase subunit
MAKKAAKKESTAANIGFEAKLWLAADKLRSNMDAAEYKHVVLGLIFLKYISDSFDEHHKKLVEGKGQYEGANPLVLISIATDIEYHSPKAFPVCSAIISKLLSVLPTKAARVDAIQKIHAKLSQLPHTGHMEAWLQRIGHSFVPNLAYKEIGHDTSRRSMNDLIKICGRISLSLTANGCVAAAIRSMTESMQDSGTAFLKGTMKRIEYRTFVDVNASVG